MQVLRMQLQLAQANSGSSSSSLGVEGFDMDVLMNQFLGVGSPSSSSFSNTPSSSASPYTFNNELPPLLDTMLNPTDNGTNNITQ
jgi:hypothetical protein